MRTQKEVNEVVLGKMRAWVTALAEAFEAFAEIFPDEASPGLRIGLWPDHSLQTLKIEVRSPAVAPWAAANKLGNAELSPSFSWELSTGGDGWRLHPGYHEGRGFGSAREAFEAFRGTTEKPEVQAYLLHLDAPSAPTPKPEGTWWWVQRADVAGGPFESRKISRFEWVTIRCRLVRMHRLKHARVSSDKCFVVGARTTHRLSSRLWRGCKLPRQRTRCAGRISSGSTHGDRIDP